MTGSELKERLTDTVALLQVPGIGRGRYQRLVEAFGSAAAVLTTPPARLATIKGISAALAAAVSRKTDREQARQIAARVLQLGWAPLFPDSEDYPEALKAIPDAPPLLFRIGDAPESGTRMMAIVGTRHPTERGRLFARQMAATLARDGITVVSGMAEGIDAAAHRGALEAGGKTVAVWGCSLDIVYPPANRDLAEQIKERGAVYSEYLPETHPDRAFFPERNRIISGLSQGVVVVEAGERSGALITAGQALEQGRTLFAVPGPPDTPMSRGTNELIRRGARLTTSPADIYDELPALKGSVKARRFIQMPDLSETEKRIMNLCSEEPRQIDQLSRETSLTIGELMQFLLALELKGLIKELSGKRFAPVEDF